MKQFFKKIASVLAKIYNKIAPVMAKIGKIGLILGLVLLVGSKLYASGLEADQVWPKFYAAWASLIGTYLSIVMAVVFVLFDIRNLWSNHIRKGIVSLKRSPSTIPLVMMLVTFMFYSLNLTDVSNTTAKIQGKGLGLCQFSIMLFSLLSQPRYWCGVIAQFFYVGVQIAAWTYLNVYCCKEMGVTPATAASYYLISLILFIVCRWVATYYMKKFNPASMMSLFAIAAIACCAGTIYLPSTVLFSIGGLDFSANVLCLIAMSGCMSLMFPTIYGIALGGLNQRDVKLGAAGLIMAILGGALITPWMAGIIGDADSCWLCLTAGMDNTWDTNLGTSTAAVRASFIVPAICFAVVLLYSLIFRKPTTSSDK